MITAKIIADSTANGKRITTFELQYPRFIHAEFMTHRMFSRNAASSRAIPIHKVIEHVSNDMATPIHWGKHQKGMQASEELEKEDKANVMHVWETAGQVACNYASLMKVDGAHKQIVNRILEPYQHIKVVCTATEYDNFFWLRKHPDAQPEIQKLASLMYDEMKHSQPQELPDDVWHVPYVDWNPALGYTIPSEGDYENGFIDLTEDQALRVSASCCAQVSYRLTDNSVEKAEKIYEMLVNSKPVHASPFEHQAKPIKEDGELWQNGVTGYNIRLGYTSGNFAGWIQHRQLISDNTCWRLNE